ncbi:MAG: ribonuclease T2 [Pseudomonadota bacterium]
MLSLRRAGQITIIAIGIAVAVVTGNGGFRGDPTNDQQSPADQPSGFDFYVLALSWSPAFCLTDAGKNSPLQCGPDAEFGFITHGLWPQFDDGWPSFCQTDYGDPPPDSVVDTLLPSMPDRGLIEHQWDKHGTCTGLSPAAYALATIAARDAIAIPGALLPDGGGHQLPQRLDASDIETAFLSVNSGLRRDGIAVQCRNGRLTEVRVCLTTDLDPRTCQQVDRNGCTQSNLEIVPP